MNPHVELWRHGLVVREYLSADRVDDEIVVTAHVAPRTSSSQPPRTRKSVPDLSEDRQADEPVRPYQRIAAYAVVRARPPRKPRRVLFAANHNPPPNEAHTTAPPRHAPTADASTHSRTNSLTAGLQPAGPAQLGQPTRSTMSSGGAPAAQLCPWTWCRHEPATPLARPCYSVAHGHSTAPKRHRRRNRGLHAATPPLPRMPTIMVKHHASPRTHRTRLLARPRQSIVPLMLQLSNRGR